MSLLPSTVDPLELARAWLPANDDPVRPQITLATNGRDGFPGARTVLLSECTSSGFAFHTDAASAKAADILADPRVSLVAVWPDFYRQLVVQGTAERQSDAAIDAAYDRRSPYLRQLAWLNDADFARLPLAERRARWATAAAEHPGGRPDPSPSWTGFEVRPVRLVFWESAVDTASRRTEYRLVDGAWQVDYLPG